MSGTDAAGAPEEGSFEGALGRLEEIAARLEDGALELDESLALFEEGVRLLRFAEGVLDRAGDRIQQLLDDGDGVRLEDFGADP